MADAAPLSAEFIRHEIPGTFLDELNSEIADFERAITDQNHSRGGHVSATASIDASLEKDTKAVRKLNAVIQNNSAPTSQRLRSG